MSKRRPVGDGMVRKREDGRWEGRIVIGHKEKVVSDETVDEVGLKFAKKMSKAAPIAARAFKSVSAVPPFLTMKNCARKKKQWLK